MDLIEINNVKFDDMLETLIANKDKLSGMYIYGFSVYNGGRSFAFRGYSSSSFRSKDLVGLDVITKEVENDRK